MAAYLDSPERSAVLLGGAHYRTSDTAMRDADGYYWYVGRSDDVFKSSDYRISPFELESALIEHPAVVEAAVVPSPDPGKRSVNRTYRSTVRFVRLVCQEVRHGRETGKHAST
jgi:acetyl-CoA synthetase